jgi:hypothetical protein
MVRSPMPPPAVVTAMCSPPGLDRLRQHLLGAGEVGDVHLVERAADRLGHLFAVRLWPVQHRHTGAPLGQRFYGRPPKARCPAHDDGLLPAISIWLPFQKVLKS